MKHEKLLKYPKRFCVGCDRQEYVRIVGRGTFAMYHCLACGEEVTRVGDGEQKTKPKRVSGGVDVDSLTGDMVEGRSSGELATQFPEVLSDEHTLWPARDIDAERQKEDALRLFRVAYNSLTSRQKQIVDAVEIHGSQAQAAEFLGLRRETVAVTIKRLQKKLAKSVYFPGKEGIQREPHV